MTWLCPKCDGILVSRGYPPQKYVGTYEEFRCRVCDARFQYCHVKIGGWYERDKNHMGWNVLFPYNEPRLLEDEKVIFT